MAGGGPGSRTVSVTLRMVASDYINNANRARRITEDLARTSRTAQQRLEAQRQAMTAVGGGMLIAGAAIAAGLLLAVKASADFDEKLSGVRAVSGATAGEMDKLRAAALAAGAATSFSASEAAEAEAELAKVGISTADILGGALTGALSLAAAGGLSLADAATIAGQTMKIFKLEGADVGHIADVLAAGANKSAADVSTLSQALSQSGLQAAQTGLSLEDTVGTLSLFADNALLGSDAGTSLKTMLSRLNPTTVEAKNAMSDLGLKFFDAQGNFIGVEASAGLLQDRLGNLSVEQRQAALNTIFGSDAIRAATVLYNAGAEGVSTYVDAVNDQGAAARVAAINLDNLNGDLDALKGSIETALIQSGSKGNDALRNLAQAATAVVNGFTGLPESLQNVAVGGAAVTAGVLLIGGAFLSLVPKIAAARVMLAELGATSAAVKATLFGPLGLALAAGTIALGFFAKGQIDAKNAAEELRGTLDQQTGALTEQTKQTVATRLQQEGSLASAKALGISLQLVTDAAYGQAGAMEELDGRLAAVRRAYPDQSAKSLEARSAADQLGGSVKGLSEVLGGQTDAQREVAEATGKAGGAAGDAADQLGGLTREQYATQQSAEDMKSAIEAAKKSFEDYGSAVAGARDSNRDYRASLDSAADSLDKQRKALADARLEHLGVKDATAAQTAESLRFADAQIKAGAGLDINTEAGRSNQAALDSIAAAAKNAAVANLTNGEGIDKVTRSMVGKGGARDAFIATAVKMGSSSQAAIELADDLGLTSENVLTLGANMNNLPKEVKPKVTADTTVANANVLTTKGRLQELGNFFARPTIAVNDQASGRIAAVRAAMESLRDRTLTVTTVQQTKNIAAHGGTTGAAGLATGGPVVGPGTGTSDSVPIMGSNGEYMIRAAAVQHYGIGFFDAVNAKKFADGGLIGAATATRPAAAADGAAGIVNHWTIATPDPYAVAAEQARIASFQGA